MFAIIDVEASGGNPKKDKLTEIAIFIHNGKRVIEQYCTLINPETYIPPFISALTGISNEMVAEAPTFPQIADKINELTQGRIIVAHNARFDYTFISNEFKRVGIRFQRKQLCTVRLSRNIMPGLASYSLGRLCEEIGIPLEHRHRAFGDAAATAELFDLMLKTNRKAVISEAMQEEIRQSILPPNIKREQVDELPEETGVYYFRDEFGKIIYIGKSNSIRDRIISHFSSDHHSEKHVAMKNKIHSIDFTLTGNELLALVLESQEIKRWMPQFNAAGRRKRYRYGIYREENAEGFHTLRLKMLTLEEPVLPLSSRRSGEEVLLRLGESNNLCLQLCGMEKQKSLCAHYTQGGCEQGCIRSESPEEHNRRLSKALDRYLFEHPDFAIVGEGRTPQERTIISIENGQYQGFAFFDEASVQITTSEQLRQIIQPQPNHPDIQKIIISYMKKKPKELSLIRY